jgi:multimeric flavodoxin WrbA
MSNLSKREVRIIGISGSPRKGGNTDTIVKTAMEHIGQMEGVTVEFIGLAGGVINFCTGCVEICHADFFGSKDRSASTAPWTRCRHNDFVTEVLAKMAEADGIIIGSPVYCGDVTGLLKTLMDRTTAVLQLDEKGRVITPFKGKIGGAIAVGGARHGGQEATLRQIFTYFLMLQMIPLNFSDSFDQSYGVACVANLRGEIDHDGFIVSGLGMHISSLEQAKLYAEKMVGLMNPLPGLKPRVSGLWHDLS